MNVTGKYLTVWKKDEQPNYTKLDLGEGEKKYNSDEYENWSWFGCFLVGNAKNVIINERDKVEVKSAKIKMQKYNDKWSPAITIFEIEVMQSANSQASPNTPYGQGQNFDDSVDSEIPF